MSVVQDLVKTAPVVFFSKDDCVYCDKLRDLLLEMQIPYEKHMITPDIRDDLIAHNGCGETSVPQLYIGGQFVKGGYTGFNRLCASGELQKRLAPFGIEPYIDF